MAMDPNNIDLQSTDPDLSVDQQGVAQDNGVGDLEDYASAVTQWGEEIVDVVTGGGPAPSTGRFTQPKQPAPTLHPAHRITTPFMVAALVTIVILVIVFIPIPRG
jgi:hypothetical protein